MLQHEHGVSYCQILSTFRAGTYLFSSFDGYRRAFDSLSDLFFPSFQQVVNQFRRMCHMMDPETLEDTYVLGHRLIAFLSQALPQHPEYLGTSVSQQRNKTFRDLVWINERMEEIALKIDEEQLNRYITEEFEPDPSECDDDTSTACSSASSSSSAEDNSGVVDGNTRWSLQDFDASNDSCDQWESFPRWSFDISPTTPAKKEVDDEIFASEQAPFLTDTDTSTSSSSELNISKEASSGSDSDREEETVSASDPTSRIIKDFKRVRFDLEEVPEEPEDFEGEESYDNGQDNDEDEIPEHEHVFYDSHYLASDSLQVSDFLRKVAEEDVLYESDSEADDSWAQDDCYDDEHSAFSDDDPSAFSSSLTCDPARIVFGEIRNTSNTKNPDNMLWPIDMGEAGYGKYASPNDTSLDTSIGAAEVTAVDSSDHPGNLNSWATFDFASVRQES